MQGSQKGASRRNFLKAGVGVAAAGALPEAALAQTGDAELTRLLTGCR